MNLLPQQSQHEIKTRYRVRLAAVFALELALLAAVALVLIVPVYIVSKDKESLAQAQFDAVHTGPARTTPVEDSKETVKRINAKLAVLSSDASASPATSDVITDLLARRTPGIRIAALFFDRADGEGTLSVRGVADDRNTLADFVDALKGDTLFRDAELPASSFVQKTDIDFVLSLHVASTTPRTRTGGQ